MNTIPQTADPYPGCPTAIEFIERVCAANPTHFADLRAAAERGVPVEEFIAELKEAALFAARMLPGIKEKALAAAREYDHPDFQRYLLAVVFGAM